MTTQAPRNPQEARALGMDYRRPMKGLFGSTSMPTQQAQPRQNGLQRAAGIFADFAAGVNGRAGPYAAMQQRQQEMQQAEGMRQRERAEGYADWQRREEWERANRVVEAPTPGSFAWYQTASPEERARYDEYNPVTVATGAGPVRIPRSRPAVGATVQLQPTTQNTPAPQVGSSGMPTSLTRAQYQAVVNARGQAATEEWARRHNIQVGD